ncbi:MAG: ferritin-like domain-containing protein [Candidatus Omnitrophota bacterium]|nr:ferritin-like domain-containing protein [Candidatus Omnitrophota bacterium]
MDKDKLIKLLNDALQIEYGEIFLYPREARHMKDKNVAELFEKFGLMEIRHADILSIRILELGGKPAWEFKLSGELSDLKGILKRHLTNEEAMINLYQNLIGQIDDAEIKIMLRGIRAEEEVHRDKIRELLA